MRRMLAFVARVGSGMPLGDLVYVAETSLGEGTPTPSGQVYLFETP